MITPKDELNYLAAPYMHMSHIEKVKKVRELTLSCLQFMNLQPTLEGRLKYALTSEEEALRQMVTNGDQLTDYAKKKLERYEKSRKRLGCGKLDCEGTGNNL